MAISHRLLYQFAIRVTLPLVIGFSIYVFFRKGSYQFQSWLGLPSFHFCFTLPDFILFQLPDGLWLYSYTNLMLLIWNNSFSTFSKLWIWSGFIIALSFEVLQFFKLYTGTYSTLDVITYIIAMVLSLKPTHTYSHTKHYSHEQHTN